MAVKLIKNSIYAIPEFVKKNIHKYRIIANPGCYPTSIQIPLIPLIKKKLININNLTIDSKSGYSGAGKNLEKKFKHKNLYHSTFAYSTKYHRHISEIDQEFKKYTKKNIKFTFNPHILPNFRGMMSTIYCDLKEGVKKENIEKCFEDLDSNNHFINFIQNDERADFFHVQNTNMCILKMFNHYDSSKIIIVSLIDNLQKGAAGQAVQCFNISQGLEESLGLN